MKGFSRALSAVALSSVLGASNAFAFPEMVRHGYVNCTSCHVSPNGGGILNGYGRVQAEEVLSTWSKEGQGAFLHGLLPATDPPLSFGGDFRILQLFRASDIEKEGRFIFMQGDLEAAVKAGPVQVVATAGVQDIPGKEFTSRRHYVIYRPNEESHWMLRAGRFLPAFGINLPDHAITTKQGVGLGQGSESYNLEGSWLGEQFDVFATAIFGRPGQDREKGFAVRGAYNLGERAKVGMGYYLGIDSDSTRHLFGPYAIVGFTEKFFLLTEIDLQSFTVGGVASFGPVSYGRLSYEVHKGVHVYLAAEYAKTRATGPESWAWGGGSQWFPWPHIELRAQYDRRQDMTTRFAPSYYFWTQFHYYL